MTDAIPTTSACRNEGRTALSPIEAAFVRVVCALDRCIAAERYFFEVDASEFDGARTACETTAEILTTQLVRLLAMPDVGPTDRSLRRLAFLVNCVLSVEDKADRAHLAASLLDQSSLFELRASHPAGLLTRDLGWHCLSQVAQLVELRDTTFIPEIASAVHAPELAA